MIHHLCSAAIMLYPLRSDLKEKTIQVYPAFCFTLIGWIYLIHMGQWDLKQMLMGILPGIILSALGWIFGECIGMGDCVLILCTGVLEGGIFVARLLWITGILIFFTGIFGVFMGKFHRNTQIPCVPFLILGYIGAWLL